VRSSLFELYLHLKAHFTLIANAMTIHASTMQTCGMLVRVAVLFAACLLLTQVEPCSPARKSAER